MFKRLLAMLLCLCMVVTMLPTSVIAQEIAETESVSQTNVPEETSPDGTEPEVEPKYVTMEVGQTVTLMADGEAGGTWRNDHEDAASVIGRTDKEGRTVADVFGIIEGVISVTYTLGDSVEVWIITINPAAEETTAPTEETEAPTEETEAPTEETEAPTEETEAPTEETEAPTEETEAPTEETTVPTEETEAPTEETTAPAETADAAYTVSRYLESAEGELSLIDTVTVTGKPGADVTLPAVAGAVAMITDAEDIFPYEDGTAALTLPAETPEELALSVIYVTAESLKESNTLNIVDPVPFIDTYVFQVDGKTVSTQRVKEGETVYAPAAPEKHGCKFTGWFGSDGAAFDPGAKTGVNGTTYTYTARFEQVYYVFFLNDAGVVCATREGISGQKIAADVTFPVDADKAITGWYTDPDHTNKVESVTLEKSNIILYPVVEQGSWITYNSDGGTYIQPAFVAPGAGTVAPANPERAGYSFLGWYDGDTAFDFGGTLAGNITLTAKWKGNTNTTYTVIHWQENVDDEHFSFAESETLTGSTGQTTSVAAKSYEGFTAQEIEQKTIAGDGSTIVNVYYNRNEYTINFYNLTCEKWFLHTHSQSCYELGSAITAKHGANIRAQWPSRSNKSTNWSTKSNGGEPFQAGIDVMPIGGGNFYTPSEESRYTHTASYYVEVLDGESGTEVVSGRTYKLHHTDSVALSGPTVSNEDFYDLTGFTKNTEDSTGNGSSYDGAKFYYYRNAYEIQFINNGSVESKVTKKYEADISGVSHTPARPAGIPEAYTFQGWYDNQQCQGDPYNFSGKMPAKNITVYAKWVAPTFSGTAHLTMAGNGATQELTITYGTKIDENALPEIDVPEGYTWRGWATKDEAGNYIPFNFDTLIYGNIILYPYYTSNQSFQVTYDSNGGSGSEPVDNKFYADGSYADVMSASDLTAPTGKVFQGWGTAPDGGVIYQPGNKIPVHDAHITLYAIWGNKAADATLTYHANDGTGKTQTVDCGNNAEVELATCMFTRSGYEFVGWAKAAGSTTADYQAGNKIVVDNKGPNDLYAVWQQSTATYTVKYMWETTEIEIPDSGVANIGDPVTGTAKTIKGYTLKDADTKTITIETGTNEIIFYYYKNVTLSANSDTKPYTGSVQTVTGFTGAPDGVTFEGVTAAGSGKDVGTYDVTFSESTVGKVDTSDKYIVTQANPGKLSITKSGELTVTGVDYSGIYDAKKHGEAATASVTEGTTISYSIDGGETWTAEFPTITNVGTVNVTVKAENSNYETATDTYTLEVTPKAVTVTADNQTKAYGDADPELTAKVAGVVDDYEIVYNVTRVAGEDVGTYTITPDGDAEQGNYEVTYVPGTLTITKNTTDLTVTGVDYSGIYDAKKHGEAATASVTEGTTISYSVDGGETWTAEFPTITNVGTVNVTVKAENSNYETATDTYTLEVTKRAVTVTGDGWDADQLYTGSEYSKDTYTFANVVKDQTATISYSISGTDVGTYTGKFGDDFKVMSGEDDVTANYELTTKTPGTLTITSKSIVPDPEDPTNTMTVSDPADSEYDGNVHKFEPVVKDGGKTLVKGTDYEVKYSTEDFTNVTGTITVTITGEGNYTGTVTRTYEITPKAVKVTTDSDSKIYDGTPLTAGGKIEGLVGKETVDFKVTGTQTEVGNSKNTYSLTWNGTAKQSNYTMEPDDIGTLTVTEKTINPDPENPNGITVDTPSDHVYDGDAHKYEPVVKDGEKTLVAGTDYTVSYDTEDFTNVTGIITVTITGKGNYEGTVTRTYKITKRPVTVTTESDSKVYDGEALTAPGKIEGIVDGETVAFTVTGTQTVVGSSDNTYSLTWNGTAKESNYQLSTENIGTLTVTPQSINPDSPDYGGVTVGEVEDAVYDGQPHNHLPEVLDKNGNALVEGVDYEWSADTTNVGPVTVTVFGIGNYGGSVIRNYRITPATYNVVTDSATKVYDGTPLTAPGRVEGLVAGENADVTIATSRTEVGTTANSDYTVVWDTAKESNYRLGTETFGTLTVVPQSIDPEDPEIPEDPDEPIDPDTPYYGGVEVGVLPDVIYNGQPQEQRPAITDKDGNALVEGTDYTLTWTPATDAGTVTVTVTAMGNYQGTVTRTYRINPRSVTLTSQSATKVYDTTPLTRPDVAVTGDGFVDGEVTGITATGAITNAGSVENVITYTQGAGFKAGNYVITMDQGDLTVTPAAQGVVTVTGNNATLVWNGLPQTVTGFTHNGADRLITVAIDDEDNATADGIAVGHYEMGLTAANFTATSPNYQDVVVEVVDGYLDIVTINITVTVTIRGNRGTFAYDGQPHTVEGYEVVSAIANTGAEMDIGGVDLTFTGDATVTGTEAGTYEMGLTADDFTATSAIYRVVNVVVEDGELEITPAAQEPDDEIDDIDDEDVPLAPNDLEVDDITDDPTPLAKETGAAWALVNLILTVLTVLGSLLLLIFFFGKKKKEAEDEDGNAILDAEGNQLMNKIKKHGGWRLASLVPAIASVIAFVLTENMRNPMILVDRWTILMVIIAVVQIVVAFLSRKKEEEQEEEETAATV